MTTDNVTKEQIVEFLNSAAFDTLFAEAMEKALVRHLDAEIVRKRADIDVQVQVLNKRIDALMLRGLAG